MSLDFRKIGLIFRRRFPLVALHLIWNFVPATFTLVLSAWVVRHEGTGLWGEYVFLGLVVFFLNLTVQMGLKDQLLREFSRFPSRHYEVWMDQVGNRWPFLVIATIGLGLYLPLDQSLLALVWLWLAFCSRSLEVFFVYHKRFSGLVLGEVVYCLVFLVGIYGFGSSISIQKLLLFQSISQGFRFLVLALASREHGKRITFYISSWTFPWGGWGFFLLALAGFLEAKTDLFCLKFLSDASGLGRYSLVFSLLLSLKLLPDFFLGPFIKNFYRSEKQVFRKMRIQLILIGLVVSIPGLWAISWFTQSFYQQHFSPGFFAIAFFYILPRYFFAMDIYQLFQVKMENYLVYGTLIAMAVNALFHLYFVPCFGADGAIAGAAAGQVVLALFFLLLTNVKLPVHKKGLSD